MKVNKTSFGIPYWVGAVLLGLLNTALFYVSSKPWGITTAMSFWGGEATKFFGASPENWRFFAELQITQADDFQPFLAGTLLNVGLILGVFIAAFIHNEFRFRWPRHGKQYLAALIGGLLMGYGARLAGGCSVGALVGGTASLSLHGWIFGIFLLPGVWLGLKLAQKYLY